MGEEPEWPPRLEVDLDARERAVMNAYELMERLVEEHGGRGCIRRLDESTVEVVLEFDLPGANDG